MRTIQAEDVTRAVAQMCIKANCTLQDDVVSCLECARHEEPWPVAQATLDTILENVRIAKTDNVPLCQDTGMACVFVELGEDVRIEGGSLRAAIDDPERRARLSGVFSILAAIDAPISYFITRMVPSSLHPVISYSGLEPAMLIPFICGIFGMMFVAFGLYHLALRTAEQSEELAELKQRWEDLSR